MRPTLPAGPGLLIFGFGGRVFSYTDAPYKNGQGTLGFGAVTTLLPGANLQVTGQGEYDLPGGVNPHGGTMQIDFLAPTAGSAQTLGFLTDGTNYLGLAIDNLNRIYAIIMDAAGNTQTFGPGTVIPAGNRVTVILEWNSSTPLSTGYYVDLRYGETVISTKSATAWTPFNPTSLLVGVSISALGTSSLSSALQRLQLSSSTTVAPSVPGSSTAPQEATARLVGGATCSATASTFLIAPFNWNQVVETGQSLAEGHAATIVQTATAFSNLALNDSSKNYTLASPNAGTLSMVAAAAPYRPGMSTGAAYPNNQDGQVASLRMMDEITKGTGSSVGWVLVGSNVGQDGQAMSVIKKGGSGNAWAAGVYEVEAVHHQATSVASPTKTHGVVAILLTHGEADAQTTSTSSYEQSIWQMLQDALTDFLAATGQSNSFPLILSGQSAEPTILSGYPTTSIAQWRQGYRGLGAAIVFACPKHQLTYADGSVGVGGLHIDQPSQQLLAEMYAQAYLSWAKNGSFLGTLPTAVSASTSSSTISITFNVPVGPLVFDQATPPHQTGAYTAWASGKGFEVWDNILGGIASNGFPAVQQITNVTNANPPVFTTAINHPYQTGDVLTIQCIAMGSPAAEEAVNGTFTITKVSNNQFSLNGVGAPGAAFASPSSGSIVCKAVTINSASITGSQVSLSLARNPASDAFLAYAYTSDITVPSSTTGGFATNAGNSFGRCGLVHDSSTFTGTSGTAQPNWTPTFALQLFPNTPAPTGIFPANGPTSGGTLVNIVGSNFTNALSVTLNGTSLLNWYIASDNLIIGYTKAGTAGTGNVVVSNLTGESGTISNGWAYTTGANPQITSVGPFVALAGGGTQITISGTNLGSNGTTSVNVGASAATSVSVTGGGTSITCNVPAGTASATAVQVTVTVSGLSNTSGWASRFWYLPSSLQFVAQACSGSWNSSTHTLTDLTGNISFAPGTGPSLITTPDNHLGQRPYLNISSSAFLNSATSSTAAPFSIFLGAFATSTSGDFVGSNSGSSPTIGFTTNELFIFSGAGLIYTGAVPSSLTTTGGMILALFGSSGQIIVDGNSLISGSTGTTASAAIRLGNGGQGFLTGGIAIIGQWASTPSGGDQAIVHGFMQAAYGTP